MTTKVAAFFLSLLMGTSTMSMEEDGSPVNLDTATLNIVEQMESSPLTVHGEEQEGIITETGLPENSPEAKLLKPKRSMSSRSYTRNEGLMSMVCNAEPKCWDSNSKSVDRQMLMSRRFIFMRDLGLVKDYYVVTSEGPFQKLTYIQKTPEERFSANPEHIGQSTLPLNGYFLFQDKEEVVYFLEKLLNLKKHGSLAALSALKETLKGEITSNK